MPGPPTLLQIATESISDSIQSFDSLSGVPEELLLPIFNVRRAVLARTVARSPAAQPPLLADLCCVLCSAQRVLQKGKLTPRVLRLFQSSSIEETIVSLVKLLCSVEPCPGLLMPPARTPEGLGGCMEQTA